ncbi:PiggyBac transposable element-derived protein 4 [Cucumispora dikerogammari]|nr:PiggyBac transposable element-derived protein 4 [Cucumispora dikerogammari]
MCKFQELYSFKTYNSAKPIKAGTKFFILAVSKTSFVCKILLYTGKTVRIKDTVKCLMENFTHKNHKLFMNNFYNSFDLCVEIRKLGVYICGTLRSFRGESKSYIRFKKSRKKFDMLCHQKNNVSTLFWYDKKVVGFILTFGNFEKNVILDKFYKQKIKPQIIHSYN